MENSKPKRKNGGSVALPPNMPMKRPINRTRNMHENSLANLKPFDPEGGHPYSNYLKSLTPEEHRDHLADRKMKRTLRQVMAGDIDAAREYWAQAMMMAMGAQLHKAIVQGDTAAFTNLWDRTIGKPADTVNMAVQQDDTVDDIMAKLQASTVIENLPSKKDTPNENN